MHNLLNKLKNILNRPKQFYKIVDFIQDFIYNEFTNQKNQDILIPIATIKFKIDINIEPIDIRQLKDALQLSCTNLIASRGFKISTGVDDIFISKRK